MLTQKNKVPINAILLIYYYPPCQNAATILEHINSFGKYSKLRVWKINTHWGFPGYLDRFEFKIIVFHYSLFAPLNYQLNLNFMRYIDESISSYKIAFFQDEHHFCQPRFEFLNHFKIDCVYTLIDPIYWKDVYFKYTTVKKLIYNIPGYVNDDLVKVARKLTIPDNNRTMDIGYRGRELGYYMGKGSQEKKEIGVRFKELASTLDLVMDIETKEERRIYGDAWYEFTSNCKAVLGVEAGVSIFDIEDEVRPQFEKLMCENPNLSFSEVHDRFLSKWEGNIPYRTISPRHFEAAAFRVVQILFEGNYSGIMQPMVHYLPLKKDFSNFKEIISLFNDEQIRKKLTENAYNDLIASGQYTYRKFIQKFDDEITKISVNDNLDREIKSAYYYFLFIKFITAVNEYSKLKYSQVKSRIARIYMKSRQLLFAVPGKLLLTVPGKIKSRIYNSQFPGRNILRYIWRFYRSKRS